MSFDPRLRSAVNKCDPYRALRLELPEELGLYVGLDEVRGHIRRPAGEQLYYLIASADPLEPTAQLLLGPAGGGKSTELYRLKRRLELDAEPTVVVRVDMEAWLDLSQPLGLVELLRVITETLERHAESPEPVFAQWFEKVLRTHPLLREQPWDERPGGVGAVLREDPRLGARVNLVLRQMQAETVAVCHSAMLQAVARLRAELAGRVVVLVDGIDHARPRREEERGRLERAVEQLFLDLAVHLHLPCHVVYAAPGWLGDRLLDLQQSWSGGVVTLLMSDPQLSRTRDLMEELVAARLDRQRIFGAEPAGLNLVIRASAGHPRDLLRLVRLALERVGRRPPAILPIPETEIRLAIEQMRAEYQLYARRTGLEAVEFLTGSRMLYRAADAGLVLWYPGGFVSRR